MLLLDHRHRGAVMSNPDLFTVAESAVVLRIGRTTAYELVRRDYASGGGEGLGVLRIGGQYRVPRVALEAMVGGRLSLSPGKTVTESVDVVDPPVRGDLARRVTRSRIAPVVADQPSLPFSS